MSEYSKGRAIASPAPKIEQRQRFYDLAEAIHRIDSIENRLIQLYEEVIQEPSERPETQQTAPIGSLAMLLSNGPEVVDEKISNCLNEIDRIRGVLF